ncbi:MAG TPA: transposase, partial [Candidatus Sulfotelmatobacter sp.]|nr:transposase [Candidatus Sulfotelmatobacter sp.]
IQLKDEHIRLLNFRFFGPKSEKLSPAQKQLLLAEVSLSAGEVDQEAVKGSVPSIVVFVN